VGDRADRSELFAHHTGEAHAFTEVVGAPEIVDQAAALVDRPAHEGHAPFAAAHPAAADANAHRAPGDVEIFGVHQAAKLFARVPRRDRDLHAPEARIR